MLHLRLNDVNENGVPGLVFSSADCNLERASSYRRSCSLARGREEASVVQATSEFHKRENRVTRNLISLSRACCGRSICNGTDKFIANQVHPPVTNVGRRKFASRYWVSMKNS